MSTTLLLGAVLLGAPLTSAGPPDCPAEGPVEPGRWTVESVREGEPPARGIADIVRLDAGCILLERLVLHFDDGTSHLVVFVGGRDTVRGVRRMVQIGDHPLFLAWEGQDGASTLRTRRSTRAGPVELRWSMSEAGDGFRRRLSVRRSGASGWRSSEVMTYRPLEAVAGRSELPPLRPAAFHDPDACRAEEYREMDHLVGHWLNDEWVREGETWRPGTVSRISVRRLVGGCALIEEHPIYRGGTLVDRLLLIRGYDASRGKWRQFVFGHGGGVWEWALAREDRGWLLTPVGGEMEGRLRILERADPSGLTKTVQVLGDDGRWRARRLIRYEAP